MKIQYQIILAFTVLFGVLGLIMGAAKYNLDRVDRIQAREVQASNAIRTLAEMTRTHPDAMKPFETGDFQTLLPASFRRPLAEGIASRIYALDANGNILFDSNEITDAVPRVADKVMAEDEIELREEGDMLVAHARVVDQKGEVKGVVGLQLPMAWREFYNAEFIQFSVVTISSALFGLLISSILGRFLSSQLYALGASVALMDKQIQVAPAPRFWSIREISELDNSFSTLRSVFGEFVKRMDNIIHAQEDLVQESVLARKYTDLFVGRRFLVRGRWKVLGRMVGVAPGHFFTIQEGSESARYVVGEVAGVKGPVDGMSAGEAAAWMLRRTVDDYSFEDWLNNLAEHFPLKQGVALELNYKSMEDPTVYLMRDQKKKWDSLKVKAGKKVRVLHTMGDKCLREIMLFISHYGHLPAEELSAEIEKSFGQFYQGALILIRLTDD